ncbi:MAG TPA: NAD(P)-dependent alcohol dehydrogenase [Gemmatimonadaceae bacterium]|nr:NAD(P)-dependent alcohol dehydrogenase [Gemmatimonadaceae bacterium]
MRAVLHSAYGPADRVLTVADVPAPQPAPGEVLVRVRAAGIARGNWLVTHGLPLIARPSYGLRRPAESIAGFQFAGTVEALPTDASGLQIGDAVFGQHVATFAELLAVPLDAVARVPGSVSFGQAATVPIPGVTALQALRAAHVESGVRLLVIGASGAVGSMVVRIAKDRGAEVTGIAGPRSRERLQRLGVDHVLDYSRDRIDAAGTRYDAIIDLAGNTPLTDLRRVLASDGHLAIVGGTGGRWTMGFGRTVRAVLLDRFVKQRLVAVLASPNRNDLATLAELLARGVITPAPGLALPFERAGEAVERAGRGEGAGAMVLVP